ncbi:putative photosynthetic complex assembly protein PuhE [Rivibacter subsaxonicus]|uniref:Putative photosynthetic complex assembly protein 2 n=1 Tax=Rivibacter subsaxonicus TaxID=457575 RepID=A0A4V2FUQ0_9BURK|nr:putative photosynthetic complex assembly protein PuhE [Rivibacter subsaxonicus]RZU02866.1 putative photosynthetic complex assembly protein 2 [Rivibacter subsaxonicus]
MLDVVLPLLFAVFVWWFSTGLILWLVGMPRRLHRRALFGATLVLVLALIGLAGSSRVSSVAAAYCAFSCALLVWGWQELAFLLGVVTGPRRLPCPPGVAGWRRAWLALQTLLHHEAALIVLGLAVLATSWDQPNQTGWWTYLILWVMRQSAKLNVFLGVRNLNEHFLPQHLQYLQTYFTRRPMNALLPISLLLATLAVIPMWQHVSAAADGSFEATSWALAASLLSLAILEHVLLVLPLNADALWRWALRTDGVTRG